MLSIKQFNCKFVWVMALLFLLLLCSACGQQTDQPSYEPDNVEVEPSICSFTDANGNKISAWQSEQEDLWYLFVPSEEIVSELTLYVDEGVTATSAGTLDLQAGTISNAFAETNELTLTQNEGSVTVIAKQSDLPSVHIVLNGVTLEDVHADKEAKYENNSFFLSDPADLYDFSAEHCVEMKGRGNSSWINYEKKGYQVKFNESTSLMGMEPAKRWILLANSSDDSMMRTQLVYQMAQNLDMAFVPSFEYVDLWINGEYRGTYLLGEKVEVTSKRLNLTDKLGVLYEHDETFYAEDEFWFYSEFMDRHFVQKDTVADNKGSRNAAAKAFQAAVEDLMDYLYTTPAAQITLDDLSSRIDVDSFAQYYLVNEFTLNREAFNTSFYWYKDGNKDVLHLGPLWDFDTCMGNDGAGDAENYGDVHVLFRYLLAIPEFHQHVVQLKEEYWTYLTGMADQIDAIYEKIDASAELNYLRWDVLGQPNPKGGDDFNSTFEEAALVLKTWLKNRAEHFTIPETHTMSATVNKRCTTMDLTFTSDEVYTGVRFAVWSLAVGQSNLQWYIGEQDDSGVWSCTVDLSQHNSAGLYRIDVYPDNSAKSVATGRCYVKKAIAPTTWIEATLSEDGKTVELVLENTKRLSWVRFAVWSEDGEQDDLRWYNARGRRKNWNVTIDLDDHSGTGTYYIHAFSADGLLTTQTFYVPRGDGSTTLYADMQGDEQTLKLSLESAPDNLQEVRFAVWCDRGGQDDLMWYEASYTGSVWEAAANVTNHGGAGKIMIHAYDSADVDGTLLASTETYVYPQDQGDPEITIAPNPTGSDLIVTLYHAGQYDDIWFPVWNAAGDQSDLLWYAGTWQTNGTWTCTIPYTNMFTYAVQAYAGDGGPAVALVDTVLYTPDILPKITNAELETTLSTDKQTLTIRLLGAEQACRVWIPLWSQANDQDDIVWYQPTKDSDGVWTCTVNLANHGSTGIIHIHVYHGVEEPTEELIATAITIS